MALIKPKGIVSGIRKFGQNILERFAPVQVAANIQAGSKPWEAIKKVFTGIAGRRVAEATEEQLERGVEPELASRIGRFGVKRENLMETALGGIQVIPQKAVKAIKPIVEGITKKVKFKPFANFIDTKAIDINKFDISNIAIRTTAKGNKVPAIRRSGFYATKDIELAKINDLYKPSQAPHHMALMQDGFKLGDEFGTIYKRIWLPTKEAIVKNKELKMSFDDEFIKLMKKSDMKINEKNGILLSDMLEKKITTPDKFKPLVDDIRNFLNNKRDMANEVRNKLGKDEIGFIKDYVPHMQKSGLWNELIGNRATLSDNLDFIIPNQAKNPFAHKRLLEEISNPERNLFLLVDKYNGAISKDIAITPAIENIKAFNGVLKNRGFNNAAKYWDDFIRQGLVGKQQGIDTALNIGTTGRKVLQKWNTMVNHAFLTGKVAWNIATQPLSFITNTPMEAGFINTAKAVGKMFNKGVREFSKEHSLSLRIKSSDILSSAIGEGRGVANRIYRTRIERWNDAISVLSSVEERILHQTSFVAGIGRAKGLGYKGQAVIDFADLVAERTQSMYNKENRALILNSDAVKAVFPFQSFAIEMFNHVKEIGTKSGAMQLTISQRFGKLMRLLAGLYLGNKYSEAITGKKKTTAGTFVPFFGQFVDAAISKVTGKQDYSGRSPFTAIQQGDELIKGAKDYLKYGDTRRLRKVGVNFGLAGLGIGGGGQINNIIDGVMADINEEVRSASGKRLFGVTDPVSKIKAPIFGVWATKGGINYWKERDNADNTNKLMPSFTSFKAPTIKIPSFKF